jgi:hypothetical protein
VTDWDRVRQLRRNGVDWDSIARDPKVRFVPPPGVEDPGRALKTMYLARRDQAQRPGARRARHQEDRTAPTRTHWTERLPWIGVLVIVAGTLWLLVALVEPLAGAYVGPLPPRFPDILLVVIAGIVILAVALVLKIGDLKGSWKKGIAAGIVLGLVLSGAMAGIAYLNGVPVLNPTCNPNYGSNWCKAANPLWSEDGKPVVFFYGSQACPYCSASSWAIVEALSAFGSLSGLTYGYSSPTDQAGPNTPETGLSSSALSSSFITWDPHEDPYNQSIVLPGLTYPELQYVNVYNPTSSIPFMVVGGMYVHQGTFVSPSALAQLSWQTVASDMRSQTGVYSSVNGEAIYIEAYIAKTLQNAGLGLPSGVTGDSSVMSIVGQIS